MKDIKFRLTKDNKIVGYEKHKLLTDPVGNRKNVYIYHSRTGHELSWYEITMCPKEYIAHDDKNQYTFLYDKNGKEIYESDIIKYYNSTTMWLISYIKEMGGAFAIITDENPILLNDYMGQYEYDGHNIKEIEVIGNIYENGGLLNDTQ